MANRAVPLAELRAANVFALRRLLFPSISPVQLLPSSDSKLCPLGCLESSQDAGVVGKGKGPYAVVMAPTRELALQINQVRSTLVWLYGRKNAADLIR